MINIISKSILSKKVRGPKKVVDNLIKGLEQIGYPYVVNARLDACSRLWIHDDTTALKYLKSLPKNIKVIVGPNLFIDPPNIPKDLDLSKVIYIQPSKQVKESWLMQGYDKSPIEVLPTGIDTNNFKPSKELKDIVLVYIKNRKDEDVSKIIKCLDEKNIKYEILKYGKYKENVYSALLAKSKYLIWCGVFESQGIALEEALSSGVPVLVIDNYEIQGIKMPNATTIPYFDERCGMIIKDFNELPSAIISMEAEYGNFKPREYILENLSLEKQAKDFLRLFKSETNEKVIPKGLWRNGKLYYRFWYRIKECLKDFLTLFGKN